MKNYVAIITACLILFSCSTDDSDNLPVAIVIKSSGDVQSKMDEFRTILGSPVNTSTGQTTGRREINWDAVPDMYANQKLPSDFFIQ